MKPCIHPLTRPRRLAAVLLCTVTLSLSACGGGSNDGMPGTDTDPGTTQPDQPSQPPANKSTLHCVP